MPKKRQRTDKSRYKLRTTGDHCTCPQYVAEAMCLKKAEVEKSGSPPLKFWMTPAWANFYRSQVTAAGSLLKSFSEPVLIKAIESPELKNIFSLRHPTVRRTLKKFQLMEAEEPTTKRQSLDYTEQPKVRKGVFGSKSKFSKIRELDGQKEISSTGESGIGGEGKESI